MKRFRQHISSGGPWEDLAGYSRAVRTGRTIEVAGTTAVVNGEIQYPRHAYFQTKVILESIRDVLEQAGSGLADVVRTRMYVTDISQWEEVGRAHAEYFSAIKPVATMVEVSRLIHDDLVVEMEVSAVVPPRDGEEW